MMQNKKSHVRPFLELFIGTVIAFTLLRLAFFLAFRGGATAADGEATSIGQVLHAFWLGLRFDARVAILLALPILLISRIPGLYWRNKIANRIWSAIYTVAYTLLALVFITDFGYYSYLESRVNITVLHFLNNPLISWQMVNETYHAWAIVVLWLAMAVAFWFLFSRRIFSIAAATEPAATPATRTASFRAPRWAIGVTLTVFTLFSMWGSADQYPLRWSSAFFTQNMFLAYLSMNPVHYFFDSMNSRNQTYNTDKTRQHYDEMAEYLGVPASARNAQKLTYARPIDQTPNLHIKGLNGQPPNIVYMVMESMAAFKTGLFGNSPQSSPNIDRIAHQGWLFRNYYTPTEGTARSVFCVLTGTPDIDAKSTSSRNPLLVSQHTLINTLKGYDKYYFIGGSASWGNIRGIYMNNVRGLKMYEGDTNLPGKRTDVWGLSDLDLFRATEKVLKAHDPHKPFFALIQSASFHRPYTIPVDHGDFQLQHLSKQEIARLGFASNTEYNSFRMADYSVGQFFRLVSKDPFFKNTIFIIHGDHGLPHHNAANLTEGVKFYGLNRFHVPLIIYSPLIKTPREFNRMMSETDVWPTILGTLGVQGVNTTMGRNVLAMPPKTPHYAFSYVYYDNPLRLFLYDQNYLVAGTPLGIQGLFAYNSATPKVDIRAQHPERFKQMSSLLEGEYQTARYILYHNQQKAVAAGAMASHAP